jgi:hypothetical protein
MRAFEGCEVCSIPKISLLGSTAKAIWLSFQLEDDNTPFAASRSLRRFGELKCTTVDCFRVAAIGLDNPNK